MQPESNKKTCRRTRLHSCISSMNADLDSVGTGSSDKKAPLLSALFRKPTQPWLELWEEYNRFFVEPFIFCLCTLSRSLSRARSRAISWVTRVLSEEKVSYLLLSRYVSVIACGIFLFQVFQDVESFVKESLFSQRFSFPKHGFIIILVLSKGLLETIS